MRHNDHDDDSDGGASFFSGRMPAWGWSIIFSEAALIIILAIIWAATAGRGDNRADPREPNLAVGAIPPREEENAKVRLFKQKVRHFLEESRAAAKLLTIAPSLADATAKAKHIKDLFLYLPPVPPEIDQTGELAHNLERLENQPAIGVNLVKLGLDAERLRSVDALRQVQDSCRKLANVMNQIADEIEAKVGR